MSVIRLPSNLSSDINTIQKTLDSYRSTLMSNGLKCSSLTEVYNIILSITSERINSLQENMQRVSTPEIKEEFEKISSLMTWHRNIIAVGNSTDSTTITKIKENAVVFLLKDFFSN